MQNIMVTVTSLTKTRISKTMGQDNRRFLLQFYNEQLRAEQFFFVRSGIGFVVNDHLGLNIVFVITKYIR